MNLNQPDRPCSFGQGAADNCHVMDTEAPTDPRSRQPLMPNTQLSRMHILGSHDSRSLDLATAFIVTGVMLLCATLFASNADASSLARRQLGSGVVVYEPGVGTRRRISASSRNGAVIIEVGNLPRSSRGSVPKRSREARDPARVLRSLLSRNKAAGSAAGLVELFHEEMSVVVPRDFKEQSLFGKLVPDGAAKSGDLLFFSARPGEREASDVAILLGKDRLIRFSSKTGRIAEASLKDSDWKGRHLFTRRVLGTLYEGYLPPQQKRSKRKRRSRPVPLKEHYQTELEGIASFYGGGDGSHGKPTANGETFDDQALTAAHRTLPFHSWVLVRNRENKRSVIVRINDRGPFAQKERVIDLSQRAARLLGMEGKGTAPVKLSVIRIAHEND